MSQSPQIGSMFPTDKPGVQYPRPKQGRNPLKSGQCFLQGQWEGECHTDDGQVAIPSNRVNVSYSKRECVEEKMPDGSVSRNPLKSGQCFLP